MADENEILKAFIRGKQSGLPLIHGEWPDEVVYHYYPSFQEVRGWIRQAGFERIKVGKGDSYRHYIIRKASFDISKPSRTDKIDAARIRIA